MNPKQQTFAQRLGRHLATSDILESSGIEITDKENENPESEELEEEYSTQSLADTFNDIRELGSNVNDGDSDGDSDENADDDSDDERNVGEEVPSEEEPPPVEPPQEKARPVESDRRKIKVIRKQSKPLDLPDIEETDPQQGEQDTVKSSNPWDDIGFELNEDERDYFEVLQWADNNGGTDYVKKEMDRLKKINRDIEEFDRNASDMDDEEIQAGHQKIIEKHKSGLSKSMFRTFERSKIKEEAKAEAKREVDSSMSEKFSSVESKLKEMELRPKAEAKAAKSAESFLSDLDLDEELTLELKENGLDSFAKKDPLLGKILTDGQKQAKEALHEYYLLEAGLGQYDQNNQTHKALSNLITGANDSFFKNGGDSRFRDGKQFLPLEHFRKVAQHRPKDIEKYWTFSSEETAEIIRLGFARKASMDVAELKKTLEAGGYRRSKPKEPPPNDREQKEEDRSPRVRGSPSGDADSKSTKLPSFLARNFANRQ